MRSPRTISATRPLRSVATALVLALLVLSAHPAGADQITDKKAEASQVADKLDALSAKVQALDAAYEVANQRLAEAQANIVDAQTRLDQANAELDATGKKLASYAVEAYVSGNDPQSFDAILTSQTSDGPVKSGYIQSLSGSRTDILDQLQATKAKVTEEAAQLDKAKAEAQTHADAADAAKKQADADVAEQARIKAKVDGELSSLLAAEQARREAAAAAQAQAAAQAAAAQAAAQAAAHASQAATRVSTSPSASPVTTPGPVTPAPSPNGGASAAVAAAMSKIGSPYVWGAAGPSTFDCSGLTMWAWAQAGVSLPHFTGSQLAVSHRISISELQPGDLVFFWGPGESGPPGHVGLYIGGGSMVHAPHAGSSVHVDSIYYWSGAAMAAGRVG